MITAKIKIANNLKLNFLSRDYLQIYFLMFIMFANGVLSTLLFLLITSGKVLCLQLSMVLCSFLLIPRIDKGSASFKDVGSKNHASEIKTTLDRFARDYRTCNLSRPYQMRLRVGINRAVIDFVNQVETNEEARVEYLRYYHRRKR